jgi:cytochrome oxidase Cu insertion factor (SCO1/SenC/PrrC family)
MKRNTTIGLFYTGVAVICIAILSLAIWIGKGLRAPQQVPAAVETGRTTVDQWFPIEKDLAAVNQDNKPVRLSDLRGKVWVAAEFFAVCPHCAVRNGEEIRKIYDTFNDDPVFRIACM